MTPESNASDTFDAVLSELVDELEVTHPAMVAASRFVVEEQLGEGAFGAVYAVRDRETERALAVKVLQRAGAADLLRFKREYRAVADVRHDNLVRLEGLVQVGAHWMLTMERVEGQPFDRYLQAHPDRLERSFGQLVAGVACLHAHGVLHRDLKPSNVLVEDGGRVVVLDFGLAREIDSVESTALAGTPAYMSPEQAAEEPLGPASDWYAVGVMLFQALSGRLPFKGAVLDVLRRKQDEPPPQLESREGSSGELESLASRLLARDPDERPTGDELAAAFAVELMRPLTATFLGDATEWGALEEALVAVERGRPKVAWLPIDGNERAPRALGRFVERARRAGVLVLRGRCSERESLRFNALDSVIDALSRHLGRLPEAGRRRLGEAQLAVLGRAFPVLDAAVPVSSRARAEHTGSLADALAHVLRAVARRRPLVLMIEDVDQADEESVGILSEVLAAVDPVPMLFVASYRGSDGPVARLQDATAEALEVAVVDVRGMPPLSGGDDAGPPPAWLELSAGQTIGGQLTLVEPLGRGGMGAVWIAEDTRLDRRVAVKFVDPALVARGETFLRRFRLEARTLGQVSNPHVVQVFDFGVHRGQLPYLVMELLEGASLDAKLKSDGPLAPGPCVALLRQLREGLDAVHARGVVHRDIKPANLFLIDSGYDVFVKLLDFGIAKVVDDVDATSVTASGALIGTPVYMCPEQLFDRAEATVTTDIWSVAVVAYETLTGRVPFRGKTVAALARSLDARDWPRPSKLSDHFDVEVDAVFERAFHVDPAARYEALGDFVEALAEALRGEGAVEATPTTSMTSPSSTSPVRRQSSRFVWVGAAVVVAAVGVATQWPAATPPAPSSSAAPREEVPPTPAAPVASEKVDAPPDSAPSGDVSTSEATVDDPMPPPRPPPATAPKPQPPPPSPPKPVSSAKPSVQAEESAQDCAKNPYHRVDGILVPKPECL